LIHIYNTFQAHTKQRQVYIIKMSCIWSW